MEPRTKRCRLDYLSDVAMDDGLRSEEDGTSASSMDVEDTRSLISNTSKEALPCPPSIEEFFRDPRRYDASADLLWCIRNPLVPAGQEESVQNAASNAAAVVGAAFPAAFAAAMAAAEAEMEGHQPYTAPGDTPTPVEENPALSNGTNMSERNPPFPADEVEVDGPDDTEGDLPPNHNLGGFDEQPAGQTRLLPQSETNALMIALEGRVTSIFDEHGADGARPFQVEEAIDALCDVIPRLSDEYVSSLWSLHDESQNNALMLALKKGFDSAATRLCAVLPQVHLNKQNQKGATALCLAAQKGRLDIAENLIKWGADPNVLYDNGSTALIQASHFGREEIVRLLIRSNAIVDLANKKGTTALMRAAQEGHLSVVKLLIEAGALVNNQNEERMTPLMLGSQRGHAHIAKALVNFEANLEMQTVQGSTALMLACKRAHVQVVKVLLAAGAEIDTTDNRGRTARETAARRGLTSRESGQRTSLREIVEMLKPARQRRLMQGVLWEKRAYLLVKYFQLYEMGRAECRIQPRCPARSYSVLRRAMNMPASIFRKIVEYSVLPPLWDLQLSRLERRHQKDPREAALGSLKLLNELFADLMEPDHEVSSSAVCDRALVAAGRQKTEEAVSPSDAMDCVPVSKLKSVPMGPTAESLGRGQPEDSEEDVDDVEENVVSPVSLEFQLRRANFCHNIKRLMENSAHDLATDVYSERLRHEAESVSIAVPTLVLDALEKWAQLERTIELFPKSLTFTPEGAVRILNFTRWVMWWRRDVKGEPILRRRPDIDSFVKLRGGPGGEKVPSAAVDLGSRFGGSHPSGATTRGEEEMALLRQQHNLQQNLETLWRQVRRDRTAPRREVDFRGLPRFAADLSGPRPDVAYAQPERLDQEVVRTHRHHHRQHRSTRPAGRRTAPTLSTMMQRGTASTAAERREQDVTQRLQGEGRALAPQRNVGAMQVDAGAADIGPFGRAAESERMAAHVRYQSPMPVDSLREQERARQHSSRRVRQQSAVRWVDQVGDGFQAQSETGSARRAGEGDDEFVP